MTTPTTSDTIVELSDDHDKPSSDDIRIEKDQKATLARMLREFRVAYAIDEQYRKEALDDSKFRAGKWQGLTTQWVEADRIYRESEGLPVITINRIPGFIRQATSQIRGANLRIIISPVDDKGDPKLAEVIQGLIRNVETASFSDRAYAMAADKQCEQGRGAISLVTEWLDEMGRTEDLAPDADNSSLFRQRIRMVREKNPLQLFWGPAEEADYRDCNFGFKVTDHSLDDFESLLGEKAPDASAIAAFEKEGGDNKDWFPEGRFRLVEWQSREAKGERKQWAQLTTGKVIPYPTEAQEIELAKLGEEVVRTRWVQKKVIMWRKCTALKIYEESEWPADQLRWTPVMGEELEIEGVRDYRGVTRDAKDPAKVYNAQTTALMEGVANSHKAPVVGVVGTFGKRGDELYEAWSSKAARRFLEYRNMSPDGQPIGEPHRLQQGVPIEQNVLALQRADEDLKSTGGWHDDSFGVRGPSESAKAVLTRQNQDVQSNSFYLDNTRFALCSLGRQLIQLFRVVYDSATVVRITGDDDQERNVIIYSGKENDPRHEKFRAQGVPYKPPPKVKPEDIYDLSSGEFDVEVTAGSDKGTRRQEDLSVLMDLMKMMPPELSGKFIDLVFKLVDAPVGRQMSERAKRLIPEAADEDHSQTDPQALIQKNHQLEQQLQQAMQMGKQMKDELDADLPKLRNDLEIAQAKIEADKHKVVVGALSAREIAEIKAESAIAVATLSAKFESLQNAMNLFMEERARLGVQGHEADQAERDRQHASGEASRGRQHEIGITAAGQQHEKEVLSTEQEAQAASQRAKQAHDAGMGAAGLASTLTTQKQAADLAPKPEDGAE